MTLRALEPEDLALLYEIENDPVVWDVGTPTAPYSKYALKAYLAAAPADLYQTGAQRLVIVNEEGAAVGLLDLQNFSPHNRSAEVGIVLMRKYRGCGLALQALNLLKQHCENRLNLCQLYAYVAADNTSSRALFKAAGYDDVATLTQWHYAGGKYHDLVVVRRWLSAPSPAAAAQTRL